MTKKPKITILPPGRAVPGPDTHKRHRHVMYAEIEEYYEYGNSAETIVIHNLEQQAAYAGLSPELREQLRLYCCGFNYTEIAGMLGLCPRIVSGNLKTLRL